MRGDSQDLSSLVERYVRRCFGCVTPPRVDELARLIGLHPSILSRSFHAQTGRHLSVVLKEHQITEAQRLLTTTDLALDDIAQRAGFGTVNTLFRLFRTRVGCTPMQYRKRSRYCTVAKRSLNS